MAPAFRCSGKEGNSEKKAYTPHGNGKPGNRKKEGKRWNGSGIKKIGILEYNVTGMLIDERRYGNLETKECNDKNFKIRSREIGKMKIGNCTVCVHNTSEKVAPN